MIGAEVSFIGIRKGMARETKCRTCGEPIVFKETLSGAVHPVNPETYEGGDIENGELAYLDNEGTWWKSHLNVCVGMAKPKEQK